MRVENTKWRNVALLPDATSYFRLMAGFANNHFADKMPALFYYPEMMLQNGTVEQLRDKYNRSHNSPLTFESANRLWRESAILINIINSHGISNIYYIIIYIL